MKYGLFSMPLRPPGGDVTKNYQRDVEIFVESQSVLLSDDVDDHPHERRLWRLIPLLEILEIDEVEIEGVSEYFLAHFQMLSCLSDLLP